MCVCVNEYVKITHLPSSSLRSYSSVKRVDVTIELDTGVLFITAAILVTDDVGGGNTFISLGLSFVLLSVLTVI